MADSLLIGATVILVQRDTQGTPSSGRTELCPFRTHEETCEHPERYTDAAPCCGIVPAHCPLRKRPAIVSLDDEAK